MSYRTYINGEEWLGNNEGPSAILDELKRQGCPIDEDGCALNPATGEPMRFQVKDLDALVKATERAILEMVERNHSLANFIADIDFWKDHFTYGMQRLRQGTYIFWSARLLDLVGKDNYLECIERAEGEAGRALRYKLKPGAKCEFSAY